MLPVLLRGVRLVRVFHYYGSRIVRGAVSWVEKFWTEVVAMPLGTGINRLHGYSKRRRD